MQDHGTALQPDTRSAPVGTLSWQLHCPECGDPGIERGELDQDGADADSGGDHAAVTVHPDRDDYASPIGTRGGYVEVRLWCIAGHNFRLVVANHKGAEYVAVVRD